MVQKQSPVIIIGAGLAGLACAVTLQRHNIPYLLIEKSDQAGGKLKTLNTSSGLLLDQGFQVLLTSYPELKHFIKLDKLDLKLFDSGALIYTSEGIRLLANPMLHPTHLLNESFSDLVSLKDKALVLKLVLQSHTHSPQNLNSTTTMEFLKSFGFSEKFIELFWRPFLAGVFLDVNLEVEAEYFLFLLKNFSMGRVGVPRLGMQQIPLQMFRQLYPSSVKLNTAVSSFTAQEVVLENGETLKARAVVVAHNPYLKLEPSDTENNFRGVVNYYFTTKDQLKWDRWLLLVPPQYGFKINNISIMSNVSEAYSILDEHLISVSVIGSEDPGENVIRKELCQIAGADLKLKFVNKFILNQALPKNFTKEDTVLQEGIYYCGDFLSSPSINGALKSGRLTAEKIYAQLDGG